MLYHRHFERQDQVKALVTDLWTSAILPCPIAFTNDPRTNIQFVVKFRWHFRADKIWSPRAFSSSYKFKTVVIATSLRSQSVRSGLKLRPDARSGTWFVGANSLCLLVDFRPAVMALPIVVPDLVVIAEVEGQQTGARGETRLVQVLRYGIFVTFHPLPTRILLCERKRKRSDSVLYMTKAPTPTEKIQKASWQHKKRHKKLRLHNDCGPT